MGRTNSRRNDQRFQKESTRTKRDRKYENKRERKRTHKLDVSAALVLEEEDEH